MDLSNPLILVYSTAISRDEIWLDRLGCEHSRPSYIKKTCDSENLASYTKVTSKVWQEWKAWVLSREFHFVYSHSVQLLSLTLQRRNYSCGDQKTPLILHPPTISPSLILQTSAWPTVSSGFWSENREQNKVETLRRYFFSVKKERNKTTCQLLDDSSSAGTSNHPLIDQRGGIQKLRVSFYRRNLRYVSIKRHKNAAKSFWNTLTSGKCVGC